MVLLNIGILKSSLDADFDIPGGESNVEIAYIDVSDGGRRVLPRTEFLEIGVRLLMATDFRQKRMMEILLKSVQIVPPASLSPLQLFFNKLGWGQMEPGFSAQPTIILAEGKAKVDNETSEDVTTASKNTGGQGLISNSTIIGIVVAIVIVSTCACCLIFYKQASTLLGRISQRIRWFSWSRKSRSKEKTSLAQASANRFLTSGKTIGDFSRVEVKSGNGTVGTGAENKNSKLKMNKSADNSLSSLQHAKIKGEQKILGTPIRDTPKRQETYEDLDRTRQMRSDMYLAEPSIEIGRCGYHEHKPHCNTVSVRDEIDQTKELRELRRKRGQLQVAPNFVEKVVAGIALQDNNSRYSVYLLC